MKKVLLPLLAAATLFGCIKERETTEDKLPINISTATAKIENRTTMTGDKVVFASGDKIGVFETAANGTSAFEWTYNTAWANPVTMYWKDKTSTHNFYAFYPYVAATDAASIQMPALEAQTGDASGLAKCGFLYATPKDGVTYTSAGTKEGTVDLNFKHTSALLVLNVKSTSGAEGSTFKSFSLSKADSDMATQYKYNIKTPAVVKTGATSVNAITVTPSSEQTITTTAKPYYVVINDATPKSIDFEIAFTKDGSNYTATGVLDLKDGDKFTAGSKYTYTVTVSLNDITIGNAAIDDWTGIDGGDVSAN